MSRRLGLGLGLGPGSIAFCLAFAVYAAIAPGGVLWMDPGELAAAGFTLGSSHPPGHPGHAMLAKLASLLPIGEVAYRVALVSAGAMALAMTGVIAAAAELVPGQEVGRGVSAGLFALSPAAVVNATRAEVYAAACACAVWSVVFALRFCRADKDRARAPDALCAIGLGAGVAWFHPAIGLAIFLPVACALCVAARARLRRLAPAALALMALAAAIYAYLPLRAGAPVVWDAPDTAAGLFRAATAAAYHGNLGLDGAAGRFASLWALVGEGIALGALFSGLVGLAFGALTGLRGASWVLAAAALVVFGAALQERINPDARGYVLVAVALVSVGVAVACEAAVKALPVPEDVSWRRAAAAVVMVPVIAIGWIAGGSGLALDDSEDVAQLVDETAGAMPPGPGLFVATSDHMLFPLRYERYVAGHRPDVALTTPRLAGLVWWLEQIERDVPALYVPAVDDDVYGNTAARLVVTNLRRGRPVFGDAPWFGVLDPMMSRPHGRAYQYLLRPGSTPPGEPIPPPPRFTGRIGRRVAGYIGLRRGEYEAQRGRLADAAYAAGLGERFAGHIDQLRAIPDDSARPALYPYLPPPEPILIWEPPKTELLGDDLAWRAGLAAPDDPGDPARALHKMWRGLLEGRVEPGAGSVGVFSVAEEAATALMLLGVGRSDLAEPHLVRFVAERGEDPDALAILGSLYARQGRTDEARQMWRRAQSANPDRADVRKWLSELE